MGGGGRLGPWEIDPVEIADKFLGRMRKIQTTDLMIPANLVLAASILLYLKSEALKFEEEQVAEEQVYLEDERPPIEVPVLTLRSRIPPKRRVTLAELMSAIVVFTAPGALVVAFKALYNVARND